MQTITFNINNPQIEKYLFNISKFKNKSIEATAKDIFLQYFTKNTKPSKEALPLDIFYELIKQSETEYIENKTMTNRNFEKETLQW